VVVSTGFFRKYNCCTTVLVSATLVSFISQTMRDLTLVPGIYGGWKAHFTVRQSELFDERVRQLRKTLNLELPL